MRNRKVRFMGKFIFALSSIMLTTLPSSVYGFTQHAGTQAGNIIPMGHEWITRLAAIELLGGDNDIKDDPADPRKQWTDGKGKAKNLDIRSAKIEVERIKALKNSEKTYASTYTPVWDAIIGERWVDLGGVNYTKSRYFYRHFYGYDVLDYVTQEPPEVQYDHYMRRHVDVDGQGGLDAADRSKERFIKYFVTAAMAEPGPMQVWDGGGYSVLVTVDRNYFLFGRALHLFEDSFSPDHTVRVSTKYDDLKRIKINDNDNFEKVRQVKSYLCANGSEQHAHPDGVPPYKNGDVIWNPESKWKGSGFSTYKPSNMKPVALVATEATKDVWAAFIRTMSVDRGVREQVARNEATIVAQNWLSVQDREKTKTWYAVKEHRDNTYVQATNKKDDGGNGRTQAVCMKEDLKLTITQVKKVDELAKGQRISLYNMIPAWGSENDIDPSLHLAYNWTWRDKNKFLQPPANWQIGDANPVNVTVKIANRTNQTYMKEGAGGWINNIENNPNIVQFTLPLKSDLQGITFNVVGNPNHYLNRADTTWGRVGIYNTAGRGGHFGLERRKDGYFNIKSIHDNQYMYMFVDKLPYINIDGNPDNANAQWLIDGIPEPYPMDGQYKISLADKELVLEQNSDGIIVTVTGGNYHETLGALNLERQPDGSYWIKVDHVRYISDNKQGGSKFYLDKQQEDGSYFIRNENGMLSLSDNRQGGSKFYLDKQQEDGSYFIRNENGMYWRFDQSKTSHPIRSDASYSCLTGSDPVISGPNDSGSSLAPSDMVSSCKPATPIILNRIWSP